MGQRLPLPWLSIGVASLAMVLTMPGRTQGLGLFTEPLLKSLHLDRESYAFVNLGATLFGALFCLPCGWFLDRLGARLVLTAVTTALGMAVLAMALGTTGTPAWLLALPLPDGSHVNLTVPIDLFLFLLLTRGLGQSALSVVSLALIGRAAGRRPGLAMGVFACGTALGFLLAFGIVGSFVRAWPDDWRPTWGGIGVAVLALGFVGGVLAPGPVRGDEPVPERQEAGEVSRTLGAALASPAFWTFSLATSFLGMVLAGTSLFNESILREHQFDKTIFVNVTLVGIPFGLAANVLVGWLSTRWPLPHLMASCTALLAVTLFTFPLITTEAQVYTYACVLAAAGGGITVCFYSVYRRAFGTAHLGAIQGAGQMLTVLFSAVGPQVFASAQARLGPASPWLVRPYALFQEAPEALAGAGSYSPLFPILASCAAVLALLTWFAGLPGSARPESPKEATA